MSLSLIKMTLHDQIDNIDPPDRFAVISLCLNPPPPLSLPMYTPAN